MEVVGSQVLGVKIDTLYLTIQRINLKLKPPSPPVPPPSYDLPFVDFTKRAFAYPLLLREEHLWIHVAVTAQHLWR